ncbi:calnexin-like protein precursor [Iris pallida]|uniref:Calnexin-like protein n=1 Tax=Iris pallida TaxID=29817 RepID=A0AAX6I9G4_IRIPA|nr:calnexin-like protein precursor [Iris pallida]
MASTRRPVGVPCHRPPSRSNSSSITIHLIISNRPSRHGLQRPPLEHSLRQFLSMGDCLQPRLQRSVFDYNHYLYFFTDQDRDEASPRLSSYPIVSPLSFVPLLSLSKNQSQNIERWVVT